MYAPGWLTQSQASIRAKFRHNSCLCFRGASRSRRRRLCQYAAFLPALRRLVARQNHHQVSLRDAADKAKGSAILFHEMWQVRPWRKCIGVEAGISATGAKAPNPHAPPRDASSPQTTGRRPAQRRAGVNGIIAIAFHHSPRAAGAFIRQPRPRRSLRPMPLSRQHDEQLAADTHQGHRRVPRNKRASRPASAHESPAK